MRALALVILLACFLTFSHGQRENDDDLSTPSRPNPLLHPNLLGRAVRRPFGCFEGLGVVELSHRCRCTRGAWVLNLRSWREEAELLPCILTWRTPS